MSGANYEWCPVCDQKGLYVGDQDVPDGVVVLHEACRQREVAQAAAAERAKWPTFAEPVALRRCANQLALQDAPIAVTETLFQLADLLGGVADGAHTPGGAT